MTEVTISWDEFKRKISEHIKRNEGPRLCRGQSNSNWSLVASFYRKTAGLTLPEYFETVHHLGELIETHEGRQINSKDPETMASFLAYLQHHGYPTPILDWTLSPYIAAYFAFADMKEEKPESDFVSVFAFDFLRWMKNWRPIYDYTVTESHVSVLRPRASGNRRQINQQGFFYTFTNVKDIVEHITHHEKAKGTEYLQKYNLPIQDRAQAMTELEAMGITMFSLFGTTDALCKGYKLSVFRLDNNGKNARQRLFEFIQSFDLGR